mmetsp:Transcript_38884/g.82750  ORF Transcript_38884/g.82750 Transcript_38884/m.82750 type:complete len:323 (-) Transcript_38884:479-1447(-)
MSLSWPGCSTSTTSLKPAPIMSKPSGEIQPRSPHMLPPLRAVSHSDNCLHKSVNVFEVALMSFVASFGVFLHVAKSFRRSLMTPRSTVSASWRDRTIFFPALASAELAGAGGGPSTNLSNMCRSLTLCVLPAEPSLAFFAGGGSGPAVPEAFALSSPLGRCGRKQTSTAVHWATPARASAALLATSPQAARGCIGYSAARLTSSWGLIAAATVEVVRSRKGCSSHPFKDTCCTTGAQMTNGSPRLLPFACFRSRSPSDWVTGAATPLPCIWPKFPLKATGENSSAPALASQSTVRHRPTTAMKTLSPMSNATAAPQLSCTSV